MDATSRKRSWIAVAGLMSLASSGLVLLSQAPWVIGASQMIACVAGAALGPGMVGLTLGVARQEGFNAQQGRNQAFNHAGNLAGAALSGVLGWRFGFAAVFWLATLFSALSIGCVFAIPKRAIDDAEARGLSDAPGEPHRPRGWAILFESRPLLVAAAALMLFYVGDAAMLPLYGMAVVAAHRGDPAGFVATTIVVAQGVMVITSLIAMKLAARRGYWLVLLIAFALLPIRGLVASSLIAAWGVWPVEGLDGITSGLLERRRARPDRADHGRHRARERGPGRHHGRARARRRDQPGARRLDRPGARLSGRARDAGRLRSDLGGPLDRLRPHPAARRGPRWRRPLTMVFRLRWLPRSAGDAGGSLTSLIQRNRRAEPTRPHGRGAVINGDLPSTVAPLTGRVPAA